MIAPVPKQQLTTQVLAQITGELGSAADRLQQDWSQAVHLLDERLHTSAMEPLQPFHSFSLSWWTCSKVPWQARLRVTPVAQHIMIWGEGGECCHKREQIATWLAHSFDECSHGWVSAEIGSTSTLLTRSYLLCYLLRPSPHLILSSDRGKGVLGLQIALVLRLSDCCRCSSQSSRETVNLWDMPLNQHCKCLGNFEVTATSASCCVAWLAGSWALVDWSTAIM